MDDSDVEEMRAGFVGRLAESLDIPPELAQSVEELAALSYPPRLFTDEQVEAIQNEALTWVRESMREELDSLGVDIGFVDEGEL